MKQVRGPFVLVALVAILALASVVAVWMGGLAGGQTSGLNGPMIQMLDTDSFILVWQMPTDQPASVIVQSEEGNFSKTFPAKPEIGRYEVPITGLSPGTYYDYTIELADTDEPLPPLAEGRTRTAPEPGGAFRFMAFGDSGDGKETQYELAEMMPAHEPDLVIHTGDLVYPDGAAEAYPEKFWTPYDELLDRAAFYPTVGNHDYNDYGGNPLFDNFILPRNGPEGTQPERHYYFDIGDVRFVCLDINETFENLRDHVVPWLDRILAEAGDRWKVAFYHYPVYTNGHYPQSGKMHTLIVPMFDRHHVALGFNGHNHMYERSKPMRYERIAEPGEGTVYITTAAGGNPLYDIDEPKPDFLAVQDNSQHSFTIVDVSPERLDIQQIGIDGSIMDEFSIERRDSAGTTQPADESEASTQTASAR
jgi:predicted phosphodiesterase